MKNKVELIGIYGSDKTHALSAWTSTFSELNIDIPENIEDRVDIIFDYISKTKKKHYGELLKQLAWNHHETPYEKSCIHILATTDIATHIQIIKHRVAVSVNTESARYKELKEDKYYIPDDWPEEWKEVLKEHTERGNRLYHECLDKFDKKYNIKRKRAKETARFFKSYNSQLVQDVMFNFRSFMHFQMLRNEEHAQDEIRELAQEVYELVKATGKFSYSIKAYEPVIKFLQLQETIIEFMTELKLDSKEDWEKLRYEHLNFKNKES